MKKLSMENSKTSNPSPRILARSLARELSKQDLALVAGGAMSSSSWSSSNSGEGDDGGGDD